MDEAEAWALLARSAARELRQELTLVIGYAELLVLPGVSDSQRGAPVAVICAAAARMAAALDRLEGPGALPDPGRPAC